MKQDATGKIVVLAVSFVFFIGGVLTLSMDRGPGRTIILTCVVVALLAIAVRQTFRKKEKNN